MELREKQTQEKQTHDFVQARFIQWSFNIEAAPWQGGIFERLLQSTKRILRKSLRKEALTHDKLSTLLFIHVRSRRM